MSRPFTNPGDERLHTAAAAFPYPPTPDIAGAVEQRLAPAAGRPRRGRPRWRPIIVAGALALALVLGVGLLATPGAQALVRAIAIQIGVIRIVVATPPGPPPATPVPTPSVLPVPLRDLAGETTLAAAQQQLPFPLRMPTYPTNLGPPDRVYVQDLEGAVAILTWRDPTRSEHVRLSLWLLRQDIYGEKMLGASTILQETQVHGQHAVWLSGPHMLRLTLRPGLDDLRPRRLVEGNVLIWEEDHITYRLETMLPLAEAVRVAESLQLLPPLSTPPPTPASR